MLADVKSNKEVLVLDATTQYKHLMSCGIFKGTKLRVLRNDQWQGIILIELYGKRMAIRKEDAKFIKVQELT